MKRFSLAAVALLSVFLLPAAAHATTGYSTANVNMRSGPSTWYPAVAVVPQGSPVFVHGCIHDMTWCDVDWGAMRGWINSYYLTVPFQSRRVIVAHAPWISVPVVSFHFDNYWNRHYRSRPFYRDRSRWERRHRDYWNSRNSGPSRRAHQSSSPEPRRSQPQQPTPEYQAPPPRQQYEAPNHRRIRGSDARRQGDYENNNPQRSADREGRRRGNSRN